MIPIVSSVWSRSPPPSRPPEVLGLGFRIKSPPDNFPGQGPQRLQKREPGTAGRTPAVSPKVHNTGATTSRRESERVTERERVRERERMLIKRKKERKKKRERERDRQEERVLIGYPPHSTCSLCNVLSSRTGGKLCFGSEPYALKPKDPQSPKSLNPLGLNAQKA